MKVMVEPVTNEQTTALKLLLKRYAEASFETSEACEKSPSRYNDAFAQEQLAEKEIIEYVDLIIKNSQLTFSKELVSAFSVDD